MQYCLPDHTRRYHDQWPVGVGGIISDCMQTLYALRVLRTHGMSDMALQAIYKSVVITKLLYASSAWAGFIMAVDRQRVSLPIAFC